MLLNSEVMTNYGDWQPWAYCPNGSYFSGLQVWKRSTEADNGDWDHAGVVSIGFKCEDPMDRRNQHEVIGQCAKGAPDAEWDTFLECQKGAGVGIQLAQLPEQGPTKDDVAIDNVKL